MIELTTKYKNYYIQLIIYILNTTIMVNNNNNLDYFIIAKWHPQFGKTEKSAKDIEQQWIVLDIIPKEDFCNMNKEHTNLDFYKNNYRGNKDHVKISIIKHEILDTLETVAIDKLFWIKILQRKWKKIMVERNRINQQRNSPKNIAYVQQHGRWPNQLRNLPSLHGILSKNT